MATKVSITQAAIARLGSEVPNSLAEDVDELIASEAIYDTLVEEALCDHEYSFATRTREVIRTDETPPAPWCFTYALPTGCLNVRNLRNAAGAPVDYDLEENRIFARSEGPLLLTYTWRPSEERWPADFAGAIEEELLGRLLGAFEERIRSLEVREIAAGKFSKVRRRDRRQKPPQRYNRSPLLRAWFGARTTRG